MTGHTVCYAQWMIFYLEYLSTRCSFSHYWQKVDYSRMRTIRCSGRSGGGCLSWDVSAQGTGVSAGGVSQEGVYPGGVCLGGVYWGCLSLARHPPPETVSEAGGTHPAEMHYCSISG